MMIAIARFQKKMLGKAQRSDFSAELAVIFRRFARFQLARCDQHAICPMRQMRLITQQKIPFVVVMLTLAPIVECAGVGRVGAVISERFGQALDEVLLAGIKTAGFQTGGGVAHFLGKTAG
ncbi:hypothetical protein V8J88_01405 [Massilia sp. W12]|uniref:hypothetical protein n=1 Tax=Massilia sp. W12 TaxID=3126507 RepID=UPI0030D5676C